MFCLTYRQLLLGITLLWCALRIAVAVRQQTISLKREAQLLLVYICLAVVTRFTFFPFFRENGEIPPLVFDAARVFPPHVNWVPLVHLWQHADQKRMLINVIGNVAMFLPLGIVWPTVFGKLNTHGRVLAAGFGCSLAIELLQLPLYDRYTDVDDLILNTLGFAVGYGVLLLVSQIKKEKIG